VAAGWERALVGVLVGPDVARVDSTPFFVHGLACGDLVRVHRAEDGVLLAGERLKWSGHCTIRVIPFRDGPLGGARQRVLDAFAPLGVTGEGVEQYGIVALDVPPDVDITGVKRLLREGQRDGRWDYEEGCVGDAWLAAGQA
jgi:hypothetical protein